MRLDPRSLEDRARSEVADRLFQGRTGEGRPIRQFSSPKNAIVIVSVKQNLTCCMSAAWQRVFTMETEVWMRWGEEKGNRSVHTEGLENANEQLEFELS